MDYVYIDESGSEGLISQYLIFASISTQDPRLLEKTLKKIWKAKPQYHFRGEFHATKLDDSTRKRILLRISELDIKVHIHVIKKSPQSKSFRSMYYLELCRFIAAHPKDCIVVVDKKDSITIRNKTARRLGLDDALKRVSFEESHKIKQLQAADIIAWSIGRAYEYDDASFYQIIRHKESPLF